MTVAEKRSVLASWASDACAIESNPALRATATGNVVNYDDIIDAARCSRSMTGSPRTRWPTRSSAGSGADGGAIGKAVDGAGLTTAT